MNAFAIVGLVLLASGVFIAAFYARQQTEWPFARRIVLILVRTIGVLGIVCGVFDMLRALLEGEPQMPATLRGDMLLIMFATWLLGDVDDSQPVVRRLYQGLMLLLLALVAVTSWVSIDNPWLRHTLPVVWALTLGIWIWPLLKRLRNRSDWPEALGR